VVCRNGFSHDLADVFLDDLRAVVARLAGTGGQVTTRTAAFHH
jgi:hypothetical protein